MKKIILNFIQRGLFVAWAGPVTLAVIYMILGDVGIIDSLDVGEVALGVISTTVLAFVAAGITTIYNVERLPLIYAALIHGGILYIAYVAMYLTNGWLENGVFPIIIFTAFFILGYAVIWAIVYFFTARSTKRINEKLKSDGMRVDKR